MSSPVSGSKNAVQCRLPHPVISFLFLPTTLSPTFSTIPLFSGFSSLGADAGSGTSASFSFSFVERIPRRLQPSRKTVTPLHPDSQAYM